MGNALSETKHDKYNGSNYGKPMKCPKCKDKNLTTEHLLTCQRRDSRIFTKMDLEETKKEDIHLTVNEIETKLWMN